MGVERICSTVVQLANHFNEVEVGLTPTQNRSDKDSWATELSLHNEREIIIFPWRDLLVRDLFVRAYASIK